MMNREPDSVIAQKVMSKLSERKTPRRIAEETGFPKLVISRVTKLLSRPDALAEVLAGRQNITEAFKIAFPSLPAEASPLGQPKVSAPLPPPQPTDSLGKLLKRKLIAEAEAEAGRTLRALARGWSYPGLEPSRELLAAWPAPLRELWQSMRSADAETTRCRLPTASLTVWNIAVDDTAPGILYRHFQPAETQSELQSLRLALRCLAGRIAEGLPQAAAKPEKPKESPAEKLRRIVRAADLIERGGITVDQTVTETGLTRECVRRLRQIHNRRPDLLPLVLAGEMTVNAAVLLIAEDGTERIAA